MAVLVLDKNKMPLMPCSEKRARLLLSRKKAIIYKVYPFTIRLKYRTGGDLQPLELKIDPGSKYTGFALVRTEESISPSTGEIVKILHIRSLFQLNHRGNVIKENLLKRSGYRKRRRNKNLRYRKARFSNRGIPKGWLAPSIRHRVESTMRFVEKMLKLSPITGVVQELVRFDMQKINEPEISGAGYQHGELFGFELKEYLLLKFNHTCVYCGAKDTPLEVEHVVPKSRGGTNRASNLVIACTTCNKKKDNISIDIFLKDNPALLEKIKKQLKAPLKDATAVNSTRWALFNALTKTNLPVETGTGGLTKYNRTQHKIHKTHALDAACVGIFSEITNYNIPVLEIKCMGRGSYQRTRVTEDGFPRGYLTRKKRIRGFQTGDMVKAIVTKGKKIGTYVGRVAIRESGSFNIQTSTGVVQGIGYNNCRIIARNDGYRYSFKPKDSVIGA